MPDSPIAPTPYEVLGVSPAATEDQLRRAYRRRLRETHPDTGGRAGEFTAVQLAWEKIGTPAARAAYDGGRGSTAGHETFEARASTPRRDSRPTARSHGHPGGWRRERYLALIREWVGRGAAPENPYDPALVRSAPREIRHILADAIAEEASARAFAQLGIAFTIWHDVATGDGPDEKIDHIVLGPTGPVRGAVGRLGRPRSRAEGRDRGRVARRGRASLRGARLPRATDLPLGPGALRRARDRRAGRGD
ncbi:MAG: J domain-containing protein [Galbitalea sp.]